DYDMDIGRRVITHLTSKEIRRLREVCSEMCSTLFETGGFNLKVTIDRIQSIQLQDYPRIYPRAKGAKDAHLFAPVPIEAVVQSASDLQKIVKDQRFAVKSLVFKGRLEELKRVREALPSSMGTIEIKHEPSTSVTTKAAALVS